MMTNSRDVPEELLDPLDGTAEDEPLIPGDEPEETDDEGPEA